MNWLRISEPARRQIDEIYRYISRESLQGVDNLVASLDSAFELLTRYPKMGHRTVRGNTRMFAVPDYPYLIYFQYLPRLDELRIRAVRHAARRRSIDLREPGQEFRSAAAIS